jgi:hypothetical protein
MTPAHVRSLAVVAALAAAFALVPARADQLHRYAFGGKGTALARGEANVKVEEARHDIADDNFKSQPTSEHLRLTAGAATGDAGFVHYHYETPPAPVSAALAAGVWVKATKVGVQLRARVVFPNEPDPARPEARLTVLVLGDTLEHSRQWKKLTLTDVPALVGKQLPVLQTKIGRAVNTTGAYVDRLVLNLYCGAGTVDYWIDDIDIGPVKAKDEPAAAPGAPAVPVKRTGSRGRQSVQQGGQLFVDGKPFFFRAVRHTGVPLHVLRQAGFDVLWVPADVPQGALDEANREGWLVVPGAPLLPARGAADAGTERAAGEALTAYQRQFAGSDVLFYDLGGGRTAPQYAALERTKQKLRELDPKRPTGADIWDGFEPYSQFLDLVGAHRWPLNTSLDLMRYYQWLDQRKQLAGERPVFWTWVQNHVPDWYLSTVLEKKGTDPFADPIGPHPEQVRLLAYISVAAGARGLGFWSDRFLSDAHHGRGRLQGAAILNAELEMLAPVLMAPRRDVSPLLPTNNPNVKAALIHTARGALLLPIWFGTGSQFVPEQGALRALSLVVPLVEDGAEPWRVTPAGIESLQPFAKKVPGGTELTIPEFDLVTPIVFTGDRTPNGLVVWWQDYARKYGRLAARWALDLAAEEYDKVKLVHDKLAALGSTVRGADDLLKSAARFHEDARRDFDAGLYDKAFDDAHRALRPLRVLARDHWAQATAGLDTPTASPYAVSFYSLPKHWELVREVGRTRPGENVLPNGTFEPGTAVPKEGIPVDRVPGWSARFSTLDRVDVAAGVVPAEGLADATPPRIEPEQPRLFAPSRPVGRAEAKPPAPELGRGVLKLEVRVRAPEPGPDGKVKADPGRPLEKTYLVADSPPVRAQPGALVRVSGWIKIVGEIQRTADGVLFYDDIGGEPLAVRLLTTKDQWKQFHLYRRVPASGAVSLTVALTGAGVAYFDDLRVEPLIPTTTAERR